MKLSKLEIDYLKEFLKVTGNEGVYGLVEACEAKEFAMVPLINIISKIAKNAD